MLPFPQRLGRSLGTLGGGNHFIEVDQASDGIYYLVIHSGSRNLGKQVAGIYQQRAIDIHAGKMEVQEQFADFVKQVNKSKFAVQAALDKAQLLFDRLMQEYFG